MKITQNFSLEEFDCKSGEKMTDDVKANILELAKNLQIIRNELGTSITINSGYRSPHYNDVVLPSKGYKTAKNSQHKLGTAADIVVTGYTPKVVAKTIESLINKGKINQGGLKAYDHFTHYDIAGIKRRW
jgi:uncharacterized protein YcbK (DUF882 family)